MELLPKYELGVLDYRGILLTKVGPNPIKKMWNFSQIIALYVVTLPSFNLNLDCIVKFLMMMHLEIEQVSSYFFCLKFV